MTWTMTWTDPRRPSPAPDVRRVGAAVDAWLRGIPYRDLPLARTVLERALLDAGVGAAAATAVSLVPRHPWVPDAAWRLAHVPDLAHPLLPSPLAAARALDALGATDGEHLLVVERRTGWTTLVAGAYAALTGSRAATAAALTDADAALAVPLAALGVETAAAHPPPVGSDTGSAAGARAASAAGFAAASVRFDAVLAFGERPDPALIGPRGRAVWTDAAAGRIRRLERNPLSWRLVDLGPAHEFFEVAR
ncbi:hypothetical protein AB0M29_03935 [Streptomyces sp. NPDC051976]|uniref:hypothetical protein n=1 Tax=Streptomyces sp. NPDC051976 TaxID=3154947 RepID=UPI003440EEB2